jgi:hypothetical protein
MDQDGNLYEICIELINSTKSKKKPKEFMQVERYSQLLKISIPSCLLIDEMFDGPEKFERVVQSADGRLIMSGRTVIQLS